MTLGLMRCPHRLDCQPFQCTPQSRGVQHGVCVRVLPSRPASRHSVAAASSRQEEVGPLRSRRSVLQGAALISIAAAAGLNATPALAFSPPPPGYRLHLDKLDGYSFFYPETWAPVTTSGNDVFLRNPFNIEENAFVDISSPSSSRYQSVRDLGDPQEAAQKLLDRFLNQEFMSTRLGVRREGEIVAATSRTGADGREYYDIQVRLEDTESYQCLHTT